MGYIGQIMIASILSQEARFNPFNNENKTNRQTKNQLFISLSLLDTYIWRPKSFCAFHGIM